MISKTDDEHVSKIHIDFRTLDVVVFPVEIVGVRARNCVALEQ